MAVGFLAHRRRCSRRFAGSADRNPPPKVKTALLIHGGHCTLRKFGSRLGDKRRREVARMGGKEVSDFLAEGGEMGALTRGFDWSKTSLGSPETWPQSLRVTVRLVLTSRHPM